MQAILTKIINFIFYQHPATFLVVLILLLLLVPYQIRLTELQSDFELAAQYLAVAKSYRDKNNPTQALAAIEQAIRYYQPPLAQLHPELADALLERARLVQKNPDLIRSAVDDYLEAARIKSARDSVISQELLILVKSAYLNCGNPERDKFLNFFSGTTPVVFNSLNTAHIQNKLIASKSEWMQMLNYLCIK